MQMLRNDRNGLKPVLHLLHFFPFSSFFHNKIRVHYLAYPFSSSFFLPFSQFFSCCLKRYGMNCFTYQLTPRKQACPLRHEPFVFICIRIITKGHTSFHCHHTSNVPYIFFVWNKCEKTPLPSLFIFSKIFSNLS